MKLAAYPYQRLVIRLRITGLQADVHRESDESTPCAVEASSGAVPLNRTFHTELSRV